MLVLDPVTGMNILVAIDAPLITVGSQSFGDRNVDE